MNTSPRRSTLARPVVEPLEDRRLLSVASAMLPTTLIFPTSSTTSTTIAPILSGTIINAQATQPFRAVIGTIRGLPALPTGYTLRGSIKWGDGTPATPAQFLRQPDGSIAVLGAHVYKVVGIDDITVTVMANPPAASLAPVRLIGSFHSKAKVIAPNGGLTLNATARTPFTAKLGTFRSILPATTLTALITWGDGTQSPGKIIALPTASMVPLYVVAGAHTYAATGSYPVHITVYSSGPSPILSATTSSPIVLVAQIDSVVDVLPMMPTVM